VQAVKCGLVVDFVGVLLDAFSGCKAGKDVQIFVVFVAVKFVVVCSNLREGLKRERGR
jgi:hypothetical protein